MRPRIAHVISAPEGLGGAERVLLDLVAGGRDRGCDQLVVQPFAKNGGLDLREALHGVGHVPLPGDRLGDFPRLRAALREQLRAFEPDVVHVHLFHAGVAVATLRLPRTVRAIWTHHHGNILREQGRRWEAGLDRLALRRYNVIVAVSESVRRFLVDDCQLDAGKVRVIRNGWHGEPRPPDTSPRPPTVVTVGMFRPEKDQATLLRAVDEVRRRGVNARLVLVGDGPLRPSVESLARDLGLDSDVAIFTGHVPDVWPVLAASDVFALSSRQETLGIAVVEGMAAGLPTVTTNVGGLPEVVDVDVTGRLVPPRDPRALADALIHLLTDPAARASMGEAARRRASFMRADAMVDAYFDLYQGRSARPARQA